DGARDIVLIGAVIAGNDSLIADDQAAAPMLYQRRSQVDAGVDVAVGRIPVERLERHLDRAALKRRDAPIGDARVAQVLVAEYDPRAIARQNRHRRRETIALEIDVAPETV